MVVSGKRNITPGTRGQRTFISSSRKMVYNHLVVEQFTLRPALSRIDVIRMTYMNAIRIVVTCILCVASMQYVAGEEHVYLGSAKSQALIGRSTCQVVLDGDKGNYVPFEYPVPGRSDVTIAGASRYAGDRYIHGVLLVVQLPKASTDRCADRVVAAISAPRGAFPSNLLSSDCGASDLKKQTPGSILFGIGRPSRANSNEFVARWAWMVDPIKGTAQPVTTTKVVCRTVDLTKATFSPLFKP